jgi:alcohol dehydrogenase class IV
MTISGKYGKDIKEGCQELIATLDNWTEKLRIPRLGRYGLQMADLKDIAEKTEQKHNPVPLEKDDLIFILKERL